MKYSCFSSGLRHFHEPLKCTKYAFVSNLHVLSLVARLNFCQGTWVSQTLCYSLQIVATAWSKGCVRLIFSHVIREVRHLVIFTVFAVAQFDCTPLFCVSLLWRLVMVKIVVKVMVKVMVNDAR